MTFGLTDHAVDTALRLTRCFGGSVQGGVQRRPDLQPVDDLKNGGKHGKGPLVKTGQKERQPAINVTARMT
ncbi:MAG: hypothetical protein CSB48_08880 [Proteobacteria bacterium]|nr:MAG: hypothetical protein CSB48_08880 [Pseudomonadota bacterium]PIE40440.1 MAG: hypothetical protein CSA51_00770 [Gammaproteobacteria bacterium]